MKLSRRLMCWMVPVQHNVLSRSLGYLSQWINKPFLGGEENKKVEAGCSRSLGACLWKISFALFLAGTRVATFPIMPFHLMITTTFQSSWTATSRLTARGNHLCVALVSLSQPWETDTYTTHKDGFLKGVKLRSESPRLKVAETDSFL